MHSEDFGLTIENPNKVCLVAGVGPGTGTALVERFVSGGYQVAMLARSEDRLQALSDALSSAHALPSAHAFPCDVSDHDGLANTFAEIVQSLGNPSVVIHNAVDGDLQSYMEIDYHDLGRHFQTNTLSLLQLAQLSTPGMLEAGFGAIICTGNTAAYRGKANYAGFAPVKAAQRILMESIAREAGPKGIHAAYVAVDGVIAVPWALERFSDKPADFFCQPVDIAEECYRLAHQSKSAWSFDSVIRPFGESW